VGLIDSLQGSKVCIDTAPFIYFIEKHEKYLPVLKPIFTKISSGNIEAITSTVTEMERLIPDNFINVRSYGGQNINIRPVTHKYRISIIESRIRSVSV